MKYKLENRHGCILWQGEAKDETAAWNRMFEIQHYPKNQRSIEREKNLGITIVEISE